MPAASKSRRCVHCLGENAATDDHGVPLSWYPDASAGNVPRLKAPSCQACNSRLQRIEEEVLVSVALSLDPTDTRAAGVPQRVLRGLSPTAARNEKDRRARTALRRRVQEQAFVPSSRLGEFPGCAPRGGVLALPLRGAAIDMLGEKLTRVVYWSRFGLYIERSYTIETHVVARGEDEQRIADVIRLGERIEVPPGIFLAVRRAVDEPVAGMVVADFWGRIRLFMSVMPAAPALTQE